MHQHALLKMAAQSQLLSNAVQNTEFGVALSLAVVVVLTCMAGRACFVFPLIHLHNRWRPEQVSIKEMTIIW